MLRCHDLGREQALGFPAVYRASPAMEPRDVSRKIVGVKPDTTYWQYLNHDLVLHRSTKPFDYQIGQPVVRLFVGGSDGALTLGAERSTLW